MEKNIIENKKNEKNKLIVIEIDSDECPKDLPNQKCQCECHKRGYKTTKLCENLLK